MPWVQKGKGKGGKGSYAGETWVRTPWTKPTTQWRCSDCGTWHWGKSATVCRACGKPRDEDGK
eukprot:4645570-Alexandrium_andersonii.AAC.1